MGVGRGSKIYRHFPGNVLLGALDVDASFCMGEPWMHSCILSAPPKPSLKNGWRLFGSISRSWLALSWKFFCLRPCWRSQKFLIGRGSKWKYLVTLFGRCNKMTSLKWRRNWFFTLDFVIISLKTKFGEITKL